MSSRYPAAWLDELRSRSDIVQIVSGYLAMNETLSVIENLGDAGVKSMARLYELLKRRGK